MNKCLICGEMISNNKYCSKKCQYVAMRLSFYPSSGFQKGHGSFRKSIYKTVEISCLTCGKIFEAKENGHRKYCSRSCAARSEKCKRVCEENAKLGKFNKTNEMRQRISEGQKKFFKVPENIEKRSRLSKALWQNPEYYLKQCQSRKGRKIWSEGKTAKDDSRIPNGERHWNWRGGKQYEIYDFRFDNDTKKEIMMRDDYKCQLCGRTIDLCVHHIDYCKTNSYPINLITLCVSCNVKVNYRRDYWKDYFNSYMMVNGKIKNLVLKFIVEKEY